jgi:hypothetical protein
MVVEVNPYGNDPDRHGPQPQANIRPFLSYENDNAPDQIEEKESGKNRKRK